MNASAVIHGLGTLLDTLGVAIVFGCVQTFPPRLRFRALAVAGGCVLLLLLLGAMIVALL